MFDKDDEEESSKSGLFLHMSRINHDCIGNASHMDLDNRNVKILVASRPIDAGEEIKFCYVAPQADWNINKLKVMRNYNFICRCRVCTNPDVQADLERMQELDDEMLSLCRNGQVEATIRKGQSLIQLYEKHDMSSVYIAQAYLDMFDMAIMKGRTFAKGAQFIKKAYEASLAYTSDPENRFVKLLKGYLEAPTDHSNYMLLDWLD